MEETSSRTEGVDNPQVSHEASDVDVRAILMFGIGLLILTVLISVVVWWTFDYFAAHAAKVEQPLSLLASSRGKSLPPEPRLQVSPAQDLREVQAAEDTLLHSYGWVDEQAGVVRIPVERAMQLLAERGLPAQPQNEGEKGKR